MGSTVSQPLTLVNSETYYGPLFVGTPVQSPTPNNYIMYATQQSQTYIPVSGGPSIGWYDVSTSTSAAQADNTTVTFTAGGWSGKYTTYNDLVCLNDTMVNSTVSSCVYDLTFAAVSGLIAGESNGYSGILGLGKIQDDNTNFVLEWAM